MNLFLTKALAFASLLGLAFGACPHELEGLLSWSDPGTWGGAIPSGGDLVITEPILLDMETADLHKVTIKDGGRIVFDPTVPLAKISAEYIIVEADGYFEIGSEDCRFDGLAHVELLGERNDLKFLDTWSHKVLGVGEDGTIEIHGPHRLSWTLLDETLWPKEPAVLIDGGINGTFYTRFTVREFSGSTGEIISERYSLTEADEVADALANIQSDSVVLIVKAPFYPNKNHLDKFAAINEEIASFMGLSTDDLALSNITQRSDKYALIFDMTDTSNFVDVLDVLAEDDPDGTTTGQMYLITDSFTFDVLISNKQDGAGVNSEFIEVLPLDFLEYTIQLDDDVENEWRVGDELVIASTDYDHEQAERVTITAVSGNTVTFEHRVEFVHWGETYRGVDMRAEVGLLTRDIKVYGEADTRGCYDPEINDCEEGVDPDVYGGHTKAVFGFRNYNIQGAELYHMGQKTVLGTYPIHYHMCHDTDMERNPIVDNNAIHDTNSRCVTIHGSHGIHVTDNVAYKHNGHCYFLEDGGEKRTVFDNNLGLGTYPGVLTESDKEPTTFWITSPLTVVTNNAAAGSDYSKGMGIWYLFPDEPVGPSEGLGFFEDKEAKRTPILECSNNRAHSNGNKGFGFFERLGPDHTIIGCSTYAPNHNATDPDAEFLPIVVDGLHAFKNKQGNVKMRSTAAEVTNLYLADSGKISFEFKRNMLGGYQRLSDSVIVGESPNFGIGSEKNSMDNRYGESVPFYSYRTMPYPLEHLIGIEIAAEGPTHLDNITFVDFYDLHDFHDAMAITFQDAYNFHNGAATSAKNLDFSELGDAWKIRDRGEEYGRGEESVSIQDLDGSLTGVPGTILVNNNAHYLDDTCTYDVDANMHVCDGHFAKFYIWPVVDDEYSAFISDLEGNIQQTAFSNNLRISYAVRAGGVAVMHWNGTMPDASIKVRMAGLEEGETFIVGLCLPESATLYEGDYCQLTDLERPEIWALDMEDLLDPDTRANLYFDTTTSIMYRRFAQETPRTSLGDCPDGLHFDFCPHLSVWTGKFEFTAADLDDGDCLARMGH